MNELRLGQAGEHLVCADLLMRGYAAMLTAAGMPFDVVATDAAGHLWRIQVKATQRSANYRKSGLVFRFGLTSGKVKRRAEPAADVYAFVVLSAGAIGYVTAGDLVSRHDGRCKGMIEFAADDGAGWLKRRMSSEFPPKPRTKVIPTCHPERDHFALGRCRECYGHDHYLRTAGQGRARRAV